MGAAVRHACFPADLRRAGAFTLLLDPAVTPATAALQSRWSELAIAARQARVHGACPLCSMGEAGAEYIVHWCPTVAEVWYRLTPSGGPTVPQALLHQSPVDSWLGHLLHQASCLCSSLRVATPFDPSRSTPQLVRMTRWAASAARRDAEEASGSEADVDVCALDLPPCWSVQHGACPDCATLPAHPSPRSCARPGRSDLVLGPGFAVLAGTPVLRLFGSQAPATWLVALRGWRPAPRTVSVARANREWRLASCTCCGQQALRLITLREVRPGQERLACPCAHIVNLCGPIEYTVSHTANR